jgi:hypothetical protein
LRAKLAVILFAWRQYRSDQLANWRSHFVYANLFI